MDKYALLYEDSGVAIIGTEIGEIKAVSVATLRSDPNFKETASDEFIVVDASSKEPIIELDKATLERVRQSQEEHKGHSLKLVIDHLDRDHRIIDHLGRDHRILASYDPVQKLWIISLKLIFPR